MCSLIPLFRGILSEKSIYGRAYYFGDPRSSSRSKGHFQSRKKNGRQIFQGQKIMIVQQMKLGTSVIPHCHVILSGQSISCIFFMTQGHLQGQLFKITIFK